MKIVLPNIEKITVRFRETASHCVEPQKGFTPMCPTELPVPGGDEIVPELVGQNGIVTSRTVSKEVHPPNAVWLATKEQPQFSAIRGENVDLRWNPHCISGTTGVELIDGMGPITGFDFIVVKGFEPDMHPYSGCYHDHRKTISTGLIEWYRSKGITTVIVGGLATNYCVAETCKDLSLAGFRVILNLGGCRGIGTWETVLQSVKALIDGFQVEVVNTYREIIVIR